MQDERDAVHLGPIDALATVKVGAGYNSNLYTSNQKVSSEQTFIQPLLKLNLENGNDVYSLAGSLKQSIYPNSRANDYLDRYWDTYNKFDFGVRHKLDLGGGMTWAHYMLGQYINQNFQQIFAFQAPVIYNDEHLGGKYTYGAETARGNLELRVGYLAMRYDNYQQDYQALSRNDTTAGVTFYYRLMPKTRLLTEVNNIYSHYPWVPPPSIPPQPILDSNFRNYLLGVSWQGTAKTAGTVKLGYAQKEFASSSTPNVAAFTWHAEIDWEPLSYSKFTLYSNQNLLPSWSLGTTAIDATATHLDWRHSWSRRIESKLAVEYAKQIYEGSTNYINNMQSYGAEINYEMQRWARFGLSYTYNMRQSTQAVWTGDQQVFMLNLMLAPP